MSDLIDSFRRQYFVFSNFYPCRPGLIHLHFGLCGEDVRWWQTTEHAFQASKTFDPAERTKIYDADSPGKAKRLGKTVTLRPDWEQIKTDIMFYLLREKFRDPQNAKKLLATDDARLIEGNTWHDNIWGDCHCSDCKSIPGQNLLGELLMTVRFQLRHPEMYP